MIMRNPPMQSLKIQLEEAIQMLRLVALEQRTCVEVAEWLSMNYPENIDLDDGGKPIVNLLLKSNKQNDK